MPYEDVYQREPASATTTPRVNESLYKSIEKGKKILDLRKSAERLPKSGTRPMAQGKTTRTGLAYNVNQEPECARPNSRISNEISHGVSVSKQPIVTANSSTYDIVPSPSKTYRSISQEQLQLTANRTI